ncbi:MAG: hypothetical protein ACR2F4_02190 [Thermoleophilaceae bacterium]
MIPEPPFEPERLVAALNEAGVVYVIVGGLAAGAHGVVRATRDLDLVADPSPENLRRLAGTVAALGARHPIEGALTGPSLGRPVSIKLQTRHGEVHVLNRMLGTPAFEDLVRDRLVVEIDDGIEAPISSLSHLRAMKRASDRPRDAVDLAELEELHGPG